MIQKLIISLSMSKLEEWTTTVKLESGFHHIDKMDNGTEKAIDIDGAVMSVYVPEITKRKMPVTVDNMKPKDNITGTPDGELAIIDQNPTNVDINVNQTGLGPAAFVPYPVAH